MSSRIEKRHPGKTIYPADFSFCTPNSCVREVICCFCCASSFWRGISSDNPFSSKAIFLETASISTLAVSFLIACRRNPIFICLQCSSGAYWIVKESCLGVGLRSEISSHFNASFRTLTTNSKPPSTLYSTQSRSDKTTSHSRIVFVWVNRTITSVGLWTIRTE